jgi:hypothetical protein
MIGFKEQRPAFVGHGRMCWLVRTAICLGALRSLAAAGLQPQVGSSVVARAVTSAIVRNDQSTGYLTVILGRAVYSKAVACHTPQGMMTIDQVVPQLAPSGV